MRDETVHITQNERFYALFDVLSLYLGFKRIQSDLEYLFYDKWRRTKMDHFIVSSPDNISHVSHVGGFVAGLLCFSVWKLLHSQR